MTVGHLVGVAVLATAGVVAALALAGSEHGSALLAYVLFVGVLALLALLRRLRRVRPAAPPFERLLVQPVAAAGPIEQLQRMQRLIGAAGWTQGELHYRLRPVVREVLAARLSRAHGVDLDRDPSRARSIVGDGRLWELARPDRQPPEDRYERGWARPELESLLDELERV